MGRRLSKTFFSFYKDKFCPDLTYLLRYDILLQYVTYCCNMRHIATICDTLQQYVTYCSNMWHIAMICDYCDVLQRYVTYCSDMWHIYCNMTYCSNMWHIYWDMTNCSNMWHIHRTWKQLAPLGCFLFANLFRYHNDVMSVESLKRRHFRAISAGILLLLLVYFRHNRQA